MISNRSSWIDCSSPLVDENEDKNQFSSRTNSTNDLDRRIGVFDERESSLHSTTNEWIDRRCLTDRRERERDESILPIGLSQLSSRLSTRSAFESLGDGSREDENLSINDISLLIHR